MADEMILQSFNSRVEHFAHDVLCLESRTKEQHPDAGFGVEMNMVGYETFAHAMSFPSMEKTPFVGDAEDQGAFGVQPGTDCLQGGDVIRDVFEYLAAEYSMKQMAWVVIGKTRLRHLDVG